MIETNSGLRRSTAENAEFPESSKTLNIIGGGRVGTTIGLLWRRAGMTTVRSVLCRTDASASAAVRIIGAGHPTTDPASLSRADVHLIAVPDDSIEDVTRSLSKMVDLSGSIVFHVSGVSTSDILRSAAERGASTASVHPMKSFADPTAAAETFAGTWCGVEGSVEALDSLKSMFETVGGRIVEIDPAAKALYHSAGVMASNFVVALFSAAQRSLIAAGLGKDRSQEMIIPMMRGTVDNIGRLGAVDALTGPVMRGDVSTVDAHIRALTQWDGAIARLYATMSDQLIDIAEQAGTQTAALDAIAGLLAPERSAD